MIARVTANAEPTGGAAGGPRPVLSRTPNAGDVEGLVALYVPGAVLAFPPGRPAAWRDEIRRVYAELLAG